MASLLVSTKLLNYSFFFIISINIINVSAHQFQIGGPNGNWAKPITDQNDTTTHSYLEWAAINRFHVGDTVYFKYKKNDDSVLVVNQNDYINCNVSNPIAKFEDGNTVFRFDRYGFFYFISGKPGHCKSGQRIVIRVMVHPEFEAPTPTPTPTPSPWAGGPGSSEGGSGSGSGSGSVDEWGTPSTNSTVILSVASYFFTALGGMLVILYLFI